MPAAGSPVAVSVIVATSSTTPTRSYTIKIDAAALGGHRAQSISLAVVANPDFRVAVAKASLTAKAGSAATFAVTVTSLDGYSTPVSLNCGAGAPPTCTITPATVTPSGGGAGASVSVESDQPGNYNFTVSGQSMDNPPLIRTAGVSFIATSKVFSFSLENTSGPQTVRAGQTASFTVRVAPQTQGDVFPSTVAFGACADAPPLSTCAITPAQIAGGNGAATVTVSVTTTAPVLASLGGRGLLLLYAFCLPGMAFLFVPKRRSRIGALLLVAALLTSCGGGLTGSGKSGGGGAGQPGTAPGAYAVSVVATCAGTPGSLALNLTVD